jgi:hypothetical protein
MPRRHSCSENRRHQPLHRTDRRRLRLRHLLDHPLLLPRHQFDQRPLLPQPPRRSHLPDHRYQPLRPRYRRWRRHPRMCHRRIPRHPWCWFPRGLTRRRFRPSGHQRSHPCPRARRMTRRPRQCPDVQRLGVLLLTRPSRRRSVNSHRQPSRPIGRRVGLNASWCPGIPATEESDHRTRRRSGLGAQAVITTGAIFARSRRFVHAGARKRRRPPSSPAVSIATLTSGQARQQRGCRGPPCPTEGLTWHAAASYLTTPPQRLSTQAQPDSPY